MRSLVPPLCFILALLCFTVGFSMLVVGEPEADIALHRARLVAEETEAQRLEEELGYRRWRRRVVLGGLFGAAALLTVSGFVTMRPPR